MKFIHVADVHLDSQAIGLKSVYGQSPLSISKLIRDAFVSLVDLALDHSAEFIVIAGDLFDSNWKDYSVGLFFIQQMKRLKCPIYYIRGNHDAENRLIKSLPYPDNVHVFSSDKPQTIINEDLQVAIHGQSYALFHTQEDLARNYPKALRGYLNIGLLHTSGPLKSRTDPYAPYDERHLFEKNYDYWALGHLHQPQIVKANSPTIVYSGALQGRQIQESGPKGCYLVTVEDFTIANLDFCPLGMGIWHKLEIDLSGLSNESELKTALTAQLKAERNIMNQSIVILRVIFKGYSLFGNSFGLKYDEWVHKLHCWLSDEFSIPIYIEKLIDETAAQDNYLDSSSLCRPLIQNLKSKSNQEWVQKTFEKEWKEFMNNLPPEIANQECVTAIQEELTAEDSYVKLIKHFENYVLEAGK